MSKSQCKAMTEEQITAMAESIATAIFTSDNDYYRGHLIMLHDDRGAIGGRYIEDVKAIIATHLRGKRKRITPDTLLTEIGLHPAVLLSLQRDGLRTVRDVLDSDDDTLGVREMIANLVLSALQRTE